VDARDLSVDGLEPLEQLATDDLHALATHQRYLDMKYNRKDE
jgi:hypothetical protein